MKENTDLALIQVAKEKLSPTYREQLVDLFVAVPKRTFQAFFARVFQKWGHPTPMDNAANTQRMSKPWDPIQDIASLIKQIKDGAVFSYMVKDRQGPRNYRSRTYSPLWALCIPVPRMEAQTRGRTYSPLWALCIPVPRMEGQTRGRT